MPCAEMPADDSSVKDALQHSSKGSEFEIIDSQCSCVPLALHEAEQRCNGRNKKDQEAEPRPITVIQVPNNSYIWKTSAAAIAAFELIPLRG